MSLVLQQFQYDTVTDTDTHTHTHTHPFNGLTALFLDYPGEPVLER